MLVAEAVALVVDDAALGSITLSGTAMFIIAAILPKGSAIGMRGPNIMGFALRIAMLRARYLGMRCGYMRERCS